ncbi:Six-hairpin glycosidase-like protein [Chlamydoabsidia padenii]|nr:Six-hairpin glycosidase-like protein [Chlamydoabsidia padenii]
MIKPNILNTLLLVLFITICYDYTSDRQSCIYALDSPLQAIWTSRRITTTHCDQSLLLNQTWVKHQREQSLHYLLRNVNPGGTKRGFIAASPSKVHPNYFYTWTRDASLVTLVLATLQQDDSTEDLNQVLFDYVEFQLHTQRIANQTPCQCLGEPKFNADGSTFTGDWGRPQNDGPAERAITMILFANILRKQQDHDDYINSTLKPSIYLDLDYVVKTWETPCFDLWEEVNGIHFFTLMVMRRGLLDGSTFSLDQGDMTRAHQYRHTARQIEHRLNMFWSSSDNYIKVTQNQVKGRPKPSGLDISTLIAANLAASLNDGFFTPGSDKVLATAKVLENTFSQLYPINKNLNHDGVAMGRYPEDIYDGYGTSQGNPWFLATAAMAELYYGAMMEWREQGRVQVNEINHNFFKQRDPAVELGHVYFVGNQDFDDLLHTLAFEADRFLITIQHHQQDNGALSEQFNRLTGYQQGALDLTWSYASFISALRIRSLFFF